MIAEIKKELAGLAVTRKTLRDFGLLFCAVFVISAGVMYWKNKPAWIWPAAAGAAFFLAAVIYPMALRLLFHLWMTLAAVMGWVMTRVVLVAAFSLIMTPLALVLRIMGKDLLDKKLRKDAPSYWKKHDKISDWTRYRQQY
jgi:hypothetical protein